MPAFVNKLNDKQKVVFYFTVGIVGLALIDRLFFGPVWDKTKNIREEIDRQTASYSRDLKFLDYSDRISKNSATFSKYFSQPAKDDDVVNAEFLSLIERLASDTKVTLIKSNPSEPKKEKNSSQYFANLDCSGQLKDVISFMHHINTSDELLKIARFNMTPKRGSDGEVSASMMVVKLMITPTSEPSSKAPVKK